MIRSGDLTEIGHILKTHGINGELAATVDADIDLESIKCIVLNIDGINVPFFINNVRSRGAEAVLLTIDGISDEKSACDLCGLDIYALTSELNRENDFDEDGFYVSDLIGYTLLSVDGKHIGIVDNYDDSTANTLLLVKDENGKIQYIPLADQLVEEFNPEDKTLTLDLPEGVLDL